jgi:hypothetical protein
MGVSDQLHAPAALLPGKKPLVPIGWDARWAPEPVWTQCLAGIRTPIVQPVVSRYTDWAILALYLNTSLSQLFHYPVTYFLPC